MTREKAIDLLDNLNGMIEDSRNSDYDTAFKMAIKALKQEPCEDCISRQAVLDEMYKRRVDGDAITAGFIKNLPPVTPQPKMGRWIVNEWDNISCSECGCTALYDKVYPGESVFGKAIRVKSNFCPTCGAKMKGSKR